MRPDCNGQSGWTLSDAETANIASVVALRFTSWSCTERTGRYVIAGTSYGAGTSANTYCSADCVATLEPERQSLTDLGQVAEWLKARAWRARRR